MANKLADKIKALTVQSCADGSMRINIAYHQEPIEPDATPVGLSTRYWIAGRIEEILNAHLWSEKYWPSKGASQ